MSDIIAITFKKLLGKGRAWLTPKGFTSEVLDILSSPLSDLKAHFTNLKFVHFSTTFVDKNNIKNGEELFGLNDTEGKSLETRAANVQGQWTIFGGSQNYKQIELILNKKGLPIRVIENIPETYSKYGARNIGNGILQLEDGKKDPIKITNGKHSFIIQAYDFLSPEELDIMIETVVKIKPAQNGVYYLPRFLRKKEIHHVLTKSQMQKIKKCRYCDCRSKGDINA